MSLNGSGEILAYGAFHALTASLNSAQVSNNRRCYIRRLLGNLCEMSWPSQIKSYSKAVHQNVTTADVSNLPFCQQYQQFRQRFKQHCTYMSSHFVEATLPRLGIRDMDTQGNNCETLPQRRTQVILH